MLPNPVNSAHLRARPPEREPGPGRRFVAAGRLAPVKGFDRLIDLFAAVGPGDRLCLFGDGPERTMLEDRARAHGLGGRVRFAGFDPAPWPFYAGADAMLVSSRWEGLPNVALEALACGTPVIATPESGGIAEVAAAAPAGAVTIAAWGDDFGNALKRVAPSPAGGMRPSLLPERYERDRVIERFRAVIGLSRVPRAAEKRVHEDAPALRPAVHGGGRRRRGPRRPCPRTGAWPMTGGPENRLATSRSRAAGPPPGSTCQGS